MIFDPLEALGVQIEEKQQFQLFASLAFDMVWMYRNASEHGGIKLDMKCLALKV